MAVYFVETVIKNITINILIYDLINKNKTL